MVGGGWDSSLAVKWQGNEMETIKKLWQSDINKIRLITLLAFLVITLATAWQSDDAYHAYAMAKNLVEGKGFVYNVGERVTASTSPLFTLIIAVGYLLTGRMFMVSIFISVLFSAGAYYILCRYFCKSVKQVILCFLALCGSVSFISYTTSGLENCLLFFLYALWMKLYFESDTYSGRELLGMAFLISAIALARMDAVVIAAPMAVYVYLFKRRGVSFIRGVLLGVLGLLPFVLWILFSLFYYGFPFPNPAYVKLGTGIPQIEYYARGVCYYLVTAMNDLLVLLIPFGFCVAAVVIRKAKYMVMALGVVLYGFYILHIGGDFMLGRHFTVIFLISVMGFMAMENGELGVVGHGGVVRGAFAAMVLGGVVFAVTIPQLISSQYLHLEGGVVDERRFYFYHTSLFNNLRKDLKEVTHIRWTFDTQVVDELKACKVRGGVIRSNAVGLVRYANGIIRYYTTDLYLTDVYGLGDPFLARLPAVRAEGWRVGHVAREFPEGYEETVRTGENVIRDEDLRKYYDKLCLITRGKLWDRERIGAIIRMNLGKYDYLLEHYKQSLGYCRGGGGGKGWRWYFPARHDVWIR